MALKVFKTDARRQSFSFMQVHCRLMQRPYHRIKCVREEEKCGQKDVQGIGRGCDYKYMNYIYQVTLSYFSKPAAVCP